MVILYVSSIYPVPWSGPTYSVPKQIEAQSKIDDVLWLNAIDQNNDFAVEWMKTVNWHSLSYYSELSEYPTRNISDLPKPFCNPDMIIVEQFYGMIKSGLISQIKNSGIPYIIIPRGEFAAGAQKRKRLKKALGNIVIFNSFAKKASAIQYLTEQELNDSGRKWNDNNIIIPNGITKTNNKKKTFCENGTIQCVSIGRLEPYQKGIDLLIEACTPIKKQLLDNNCQISIYGPDRVGRLSEMIQLVEHNGLENIILFRDPLYGDDKESVLLDSDVFVMTSRFEGHPMSLIEAMNYGLPCLATAGTNMKEEIDECDAGWTSENTIEGIREAFLHMISDKDRFSKKGNNAIELSNRYDWDRIAEISHEKYAQLLLDINKNKRRFIN